MLTGEVTVEVDDAPLGSPPQLTVVSQPFPGVNVFDLHLDAPLADDSRVTVRFDADSITEGTVRREVYRPHWMRSIMPTWIGTGTRCWLIWLLTLPTLDDLADVDAPAPQDGQVLTRQGGQWVAAPPAGGVTDHGALTGLGDDDHPQYLLVDPATRALIGNLNAGNQQNHQFESWSQSWGCCHLPTGDQGRVTRQVETSLVPTLIRLSLDCRDEPCE